MPTKAANDFIKPTRADVELSTDGGTTWVDISTYTTLISGGTKSRNVEHEYTLGGVKDTISDELEFETITMNIVVTDGNDEPYWLAHLAIEADSAFDLRWAKEGATTGDLQYTSSGAKVSSCPPLAFDVSTSPARGQVDIVVTPSTVATAKIA